MLVLRLQYDTGQDVPRQGSIHTVRPLVTA